MRDVDGGDGGVLLGAECDESVALLRPGELRGFHIGVVILLHRVNAAKQSNALVCHWDI